jgi:hypothetical protein
VYGPAKSHTVYIISTHINRHGDAFALKTDMTTRDGYDERVIISALPSSSSITILLTRDAASGWCRLQYRGIAFSQQAVMRRGRSLSSVSCRCLSRSVKTERRGDVAEARCGGFTQSRRNRHHDTESQVQAPRIRVCGHREARSLLILLFVAAPRAVPLPEVLFGTGRVTQGVRSANPAHSVGRQTLRHDSYRRGA